MKKAAAWLLTAAMVFSLAACGGSASSEAASTEESVKEEASEAASEAAPAESEASEAAESTTEAAADGEFLIGTYLQLTGANAVAGNSAKNGIDVAVKWINDNGGLNGQQIRVEHYDTTGSTEEAVKVVQKMLAEGNVDFVIGSVNSNEVAACIGDLNNAKMFNFGLGTSPTWMEDQSMTYTFRPSCNNDRTIPADVAMIEALGYKKVALVNSTDDSASSSGNTFEQLLNESGLEMTTREQCDQEDTDFTGQITKILAGDPDVIVMCLQGNTFGPFLKQLRNMGYTGMVCSSQVLSEDIVKVAGESPNTDYVFTAYPYVTYASVDDCDIPYVKDFLQKYLDQIGEMPQHECAYRGWDAVMALKAAAEIAGSNDGEAMKDAMSKVVTDGIGGTMDFTKGDREAYSEFNSFILYQNKNVVFTDWLANGGYDTYKSETGRDR